MAKTQLNVRVDEATAETARRRAQQRGVSVNRYIEELVQRDAGEVGRTFVDAAADFMKQYEAVFAEEFRADTPDAPDAPDTPDAPDAPGTRDTPGAPHARPAGGGSAEGAL